MAIEQRGEWRYVLVCDECGREVKYFNTFDEAVEYKRDNGWKSKKDDGEWGRFAPIASRSTYERNRTGD